MRVKTAELIGPALNWAVAKCEEWFADGTPHNEALAIEYFKYSPSTNWEQGGPIIERENLCINPDIPRNQWMAITNGAELMQFGPTPLIAAMCCYVASRLGDEVDIPEELL